MNVEIIQDKKEFEPISIVITLTSQEEVDNLYRAANNLSNNKDERGYNFLDSRLPTWSRFPTWIVIANEIQAVLRTYHKLKLESAKKSEQ